MTSLNTYLYNTSDIVNLEETKKKKKENSCPQGMHDLKGNTSWSWKEKLNTVLEICHSIMMMAPKRWMLHFMLIRKGRFTDTTMSGKSTFTKAQKHEIIVNTYWTLTLFHEHLELLKLSILQNKKLNTNYSQ